MTDWVKISTNVLRVLVPTLVLGLLGWQHKEIDRLELVIENEEKARIEALATERKSYNEKMVEVTDNLKLELERSADLARVRGAELERLRHANARLQARLKANSTEPNAEALAKCSKLLEEGAGLVAEGERLLLKHGAEHDSLSGLIAKDSHYLSH